MPSCQPPLARAGCFVSQVVLSEPFLHIWGCLIDNVAAFIASLRQHFVRSWCVECDVFVVNVAE